MSMLDVARKALRQVGQSVLGNPKRFIDQAEQQKKEGDYQAALDSLTRALEADPKSFDTWYLRGNILAYNLKKPQEALEAFDQALNFVLHNNLRKQVLNGRGNVLKNLRRNEEAVDAYRRALEIDPSFWQARKGWGRLLFSRLHDYSGALTKFNTGLPLSQAKLQDRSPGVCKYHRQGCGQLHRAKGKIHYEYGLRQENPFPYLEQADGSYQEALEFLTAQNFPEERLEVIEELIRVFLALRKIPEAEHLQREGLDLLNRLRNQSSSAQRRKALALKFAGFNQLTVDIYVRTGRVLDAWRTAEQGKNVCLTWLLWEQELLVPSYEEAQQLLDASTVAIYWHLSPIALTTFVLKHGTLIPILIDSVPRANQGEIPESLSRLLRFETWLSNWDQRYANYRDKGKDQTSHSDRHPWRTTMEVNLEELKRILNISAIEAELAGVDQLILIPHRDLHRLPLHALFNERFTATYLPSAQVGLSLQSQESVETWHEIPLLSVDDPAVDGGEQMPYAQLESAVVQQLFPNTTVIAHARASQATVVNALEGGYRGFHFTGHGEYDSLQPGNSQLGLANNDSLNANEISRLNLESYDLVTIAACETALTGNQTITTEYVGLVSAFLRAKVTHVLSTLWTVEEISSAWLIIRFYQCLQANVAPAHALNQAERWLRTLTNAELATWLLNLSGLESLEPLIKQELEHYAHSLRDDSSTMKLSQFPYANPYYWAAFTLTGRGFR